MMFPLMLLPEKRTRKTRLVPFLLLAASACAFAQQSAISISLDSASGVYASGQAAVLTVKRTDASDTAAPATFKILRDNKDTLQTETLRGNEGERTIRFTPPRDGWYVCTATLPGGEKKPIATTGLVVNPGGFKPTAPTPDDFDAFWAAQKKRLAEEKAEAKLTPLTLEQRQIEEQNPDHQKKIAWLEKEGYVCSNLEIPCLNVRPVQGYFARSQTPAPKSRPAILFFHAAGVDGGWCRATEVNALSLAQQFNAIVIDMNAHGMLNGQPQDYYTALAKGELAGYQNQGRESRDQFYFLGMFLRLMRAIDFLCAQPDWDGRHLLCIGISQGGAQALAAAGLDARVSAVVATVPGMCDLSGSGWPGPPQTNDEPLKLRYAETVRYFDNVNFNARSQAQTLVTAGFVDTTCSAPGVFAAYNQLRKEKQILTVPDKGHHPLSSPTRELKQKYDAFLLQHSRD